MTLKHISLTQWPVIQTAEAYDAAIHSMCSQLKSISGLLGIYQIGGVSDYGISDIDLLAVFEKDFRFEGNPMNLNGEKANSYLFTHRLFGTTEDRIDRLENFTRFGTYKHLYGREFNFALTASPEEKKIIDTQIALEYMLKAFISLHIGLTYGQVKVRNLLLHVKALRLDLELLHIKSGLFYEMVHELTALRKSWFQNTPEEKQLALKIIQFHTQFKTAMERLLMEHPFYLCGSQSVKISRHIELLHHASVQWPVLSLPRIIKRVIPATRQENILNRLFRFRFRFPVTSMPVPEIIQLRHNYIREGIEYNRVHLPWFLCTAYGMDIFSRKSSEQ